MALTQGNEIYFSDFNDIRTRVIAEFNTTNRRNVGTNYLAPAATQASGNLMNAANVTNIAKDMYYVNSTTYTSNGISAGTLITANMNGIDTALTIYEGKAKQSNDSGCQSGCIGLCQGCYGACLSSCSGYCTGTCTGGCQGGCSSCSGTCKGSCSGSCNTTCTSSCKNMCGSSCSGTCSTGCVHVSK